MKLLKLTATFGCLDRDTLEFGPGMTLIGAPNGSGKSTWCAFLRTMLYGLDTRQRDKKGAPADKNRYRPWSGAPMEGLLVCEHEGRVIELRRTSRSGVPMGDFTALDRATGQPVDGLTAENAGEVLTGVSREVFAPFVYTALGHLHRPQNVGSVRIRYCGTPLKYSAAEADIAKSVTFVELGDRDCEPVITTVPLVPMRDMQKLRGSFQELMEGTNDNYVHIVLTDETDIPDAMGKLRMRYPYLIGMKYDREETFDVSGIEELGQEAEKDPAALFSAFFEQVFPSGMSEEQEQIIQDLVREIWTKEDDE